MHFLTPEHRRRLLTNGRWNAIKRARNKSVDDLRPVARLFCEWSGESWLLTEIDPDRPDLAFGLRDTGKRATLGHVRLSRLAALRGPGELRIERDRHFRPLTTLQGYVALARQRQSRVGE